jgi:hypothetical protein
VYVRGKPAATFFLNYAAIKFDELFLKSNFESFRFAAPVLTILILPLFVFLILIARNNLAGKRNQILIPVILASVLFGFASYKATAIDEAADKSAAKIFGGVNDKFGKKDGLLFIDTCDNDDRRLFEYILRNTKSDNLVVSTKNMRAWGLNLGPSFRKFDNKNNGSQYMADIKELFLATDNVWLFSDSCAGSEKLKAMPQIMNSFSYWTNNIAHITLFPENMKSKYYHAKKITLNAGIEKDGILLDLLINDYGEAGKAARLIQDGTFTPEMLRSYFYAREPEHAKKAAEKLIAACAGDVKNIFLHGGG